MSTVVRRPTGSLRSYPNLTAAAHILGISPSTLSRRDDLISENRGDRDRVVPASEVLRLARIYRMRSLNDVAQALIEHARQEAPDELPGLVEEIERFFEQETEDLGLDREQFLALAQQWLPEPLFAEVKRMVESAQHQRRHHPGIVGRVPD